MDKQVLRIFQCEVERQCQFSLIAAQDLQSAIGVVDMDRLWYSVQSFLIAVGNVSKLLWPSEERMSGRAVELKQSLGVDDNSPLEPRRFRNHFEHFDERLEKWATASKQRNFVDSNVGPAGMISGIDPEDYLRNFDTSNYALTFRGDVYKLQPIIDAIVELHPKAAYEAGRVPWE